MLCWTYFYQCDCHSYFPSPFTCLYERPHPTPQHFPGIVKSSAAAWKWPWAASPSRSPRRNCIHSPGRRPRSDSSMSRISDLGRSLLRCGRCGELGFQQYTCLWIISFAHREPILPFGAAALFKVRSATSRLLPWSSTLNPSHTSFTSLHTCLPSGCYGLGSSCSAQCLDWERAITGHGGRRRQDKGCPRSRY